MAEILMSSKEDDKEKQSSIVVPIDDDMDVVKSNSPNTMDELAMELAKPAPRIPSGGSPNLPKTKT